jgi:hypothetical protein
MPQACDCAVSRIPPAISTVPLARLLSTAPHSPPHAPARISFHRASLSTAPLACLHHRSDLLWPSPPNLPRPSPPERGASRHRDTVAGWHGARLPSLSRAVAASPPRCGVAAAGGSPPTSTARLLPPARR